MSKKNETVKARAEWMRYRNDSGSEMEMLQDMPKKEFEKTLKDFRHSPNLKKAGEVVWGKMRPGSTFEPVDSNGDGWEILSFGLYGGEIHQKNGGTYFHKP